MGDVEKAYEIIGRIPINLLYNYFVGDPEQAYATMKPMLDLLKEQEKNSESKEYKLYNALMGRESDYDNDVFDPA